MISRRLTARRHKAAPDLEITPFMNLMVVLVPFLLITAVFTKLAVLELTLPAASSGESAEADDKFELEVTVRKDVLQIGAKGKGLFASHAVAADGTELAKLNTTLLAVKSERPELTAVTVLLEADVPYDRLIQIMDAVRQTADPIPQEDGRLLRGELFPDISIGDAPITN